LHPFSIVHTLLSLSHAHFFISALHFPPASALYLNFCPLSFVDGTGYIQGSNVFENSTNTFAVVHRYIVPKIGGSKDDLNNGEAPILL
jgi:hypothetical protein